MKKAFVLALITAAFVLTPSIARSEGFVGAYLGFNLPDDADAADISGFGAPTASLDMDPGIGLGLHGGMWFDKQNLPYLGLLLDYDIRVSNISAVKYPAITFPAEAGFVVASFTANAALRLPEGKVKPYAGIGFGFASAVIDDGYVTVIGVPIYMTGDDDTSSITQLFLGIDIELTEIASMFFEIKRSSADFEFQGDWWIDMEYKSTQIYGGVNLRF
ncbi:MAG: porin family protein [Deltaproteobacteria bacterium]|nr:porin family protein [Deltaproteobacteria bacterium]